MSPIFPAWHFASWHAVDDRVRGGSSQSHLDAVPLHLNSSSSPQKASDAANVGETVGVRPARPGVEAGGDEKRCGARFWGTLDTKTLGGAGFASRKYQFGPEPLSLPRAQYRGVILRVLPSQSRLSSGAATSHAGADADAGAESPQRPQTFTLVFKAQLNARPPSRPKIPPSPDPASLSYEAQFTSAPALTASSASSSGSSVPWIDSIASLYSYFSSGLGTSASARSTPINPNHHMHIKEVKIPFDDFIPTYRGRPVHPADPKYKPFDPAGIYEVSLMCRSDFGKQEGEFELVLESIEAWERDGDKNGREGKGKGEGKGRVGCWGWMQGVMGEWTGREGEGRVRLEEAIGEKRG